jgi:glycosyltransferase involved in cell wall biosynthesis
VRVAIIHPWFPQYREGFFEDLVRRGAVQGIEIEVFYGDCPPEWKARGDGGLAGSFTRLPTKFFKIKGRTLNIKSLVSFRSKGKFDLVIVEQAVRNLETYQLLAARAPVAFWGHGRTYTLAIGSGQERLKQWLTKRGRWFFAYTAGGAEAVRRAGYPAARTTVVQNSIDTSELRANLGAVTNESVERFVSEHDLRGRTALFVGGLDSSKRLNFLIEAASAAHEMDPRFRLLIVGAGSDASSVKEDIATLPFVTYLGPLFGVAKALAIRSSQVLAMPGRVGLVAVDSFVGAIPIVTTNWEWHAPEFEYLEPGINSIVTKNDVGSFARGLLELLQNESLLMDMQTECLNASSRYTAEAMVTNFLSGVTMALGSPND